MYTQLLKTATIIGTDETESPPSWSNESIGLTETKIE